MEGSIRARSENSVSGAPALDRASVADATLGTAVTGHRMHAHGFAVFSSFSLILATALAFLVAYARRAAGGGAESVAKRRALTDVVGIYWHFMDALWVFLFLLLFFWR